VTDRQPSLDAAQLRAYFALMDVAGLLRHAVEQQLREAGDLSYVQFQLLARLGLDSPTGSERMTDLADGVVYSRSGLTYQPDSSRRRGWSRERRPRTTSAGRRSRSPMPDGRCWPTYSPATPRSSSASSSNR
jgi:hypothetical protein